MAKYDDIEDFKVKLKSLFPNKTQAGFIIKKYPEIEKEAKELLKKYPKFENILNLINALIKDKYLRICPICGKHMKWKATRHPNSVVTCSVGCGKKYTEQENIKKYGMRTLLFDKEFQNKMKKSRMEKAKLRPKRPKYLHPDFIKKFNKLQKYLRENNLKEFDSIFDYHGIKDESGKSLYYEFECLKCGTKFKNSVISSDRVKIRCPHCNPKYINAKQDEIFYKNYYISKLKEYKKLLKEKNLEILCDENNFIGLASSKGNKNRYRYDYKCLKCGLIFSRVWGSYTNPKIYCPHCHKKENNFSKIENNLRDFVSSLNVLCLSNNKEIIKPKELDIFLPEYNFAIEFNGLFWHSEKNGKDKNYHLEKLLLCEKNNISLFHVFEDEWLEHSQIVKSIIKKKINHSIIHIDSKKCELRKIDKELGKKFLKKYSLSSYEGSGTHYGLFYKNRLIFVALKHNGIIINFAELNNFNIKNKFDLFLSRWKAIKIKIDRRIPYISLTSKLIKEEIIEPKLWYSRGKKRFSTPKHEESYYDKIWDCGYKIFTINR